MKNLAIFRCFPPTPVAPVYGLRPPCAIGRPAQAASYRRIGDALLALTRLCLLHYAVNDKTTVTKLPQPDPRQQEILKALGVSLPAM